MSFRLCWVALLAVCLANLSSAFAQVARRTATTTVVVPVYASPNIAETPLRVAKEGSVLLLLEITGDWCHIEFEDPEFGRRAGYVQSMFVRISGSQDLPRASAQPGPTQLAPTPSVPTQAVPTPSTPTQSAPGQSNRQSRAQPVKLKETKIRGYVTEVRSSTDFDIEDYRITRSEEFALDFENASPDVAFALEDVRVGVELEIKGLLNQDTGELKAKAVKVDMEQFRSSEQTAIVSQALDGITTSPDGGWIGEFQADGQTIQVTEKTKVLFKPTTREKKQARDKAKDGAPAAEFESLSSLDQVTIGMAMTYKGIRNRDTRKIVAERVEFSNNDLDDGEAKMWRSLKVSVKTTQGLKPGELKVDSVGRFKLLPDDEVQGYVASIGQSLIPAYQSEMGAADPRKIPFRFYVVLDKSVNAFATPNGIVLVNSGMLELLENEAQLAAVIGHEIAHATHEHTWRQQQYHKKARIGIAIAGAVAGAYGLSSLADIADMVNGAIVNGHQRSLENQSDRIGLQYMVAAGYDPREAPGVWKRVAQQSGVHSTDFFWSRHDNEPTRRSYLMNELKNNYRDINYANLRTDPERFTRIKAAVRAASATKKKIKVSS